MKRLTQFLVISLLFLSCASAGTTPSLETTGSPTSNQALSDQKALAVASLYRKNFKQALEDIKKAEDMSRNDPEVYLIKGLIYFAVKEYADAEASYKKSLQIKSDYTEARYTLCGLYLTLDKLDNAITECEKAASDPVYASKDKAYTSLGVAHFRKGNFDKAGEYYLKALEINPSLVYTHNELGKLYMATGKEQQALEEFKIAVQGNDQYDEAHYNLGLAYLKVGKTEMACMSFQKAAEISPGSSIGVNAKSYLNSLCSELQNNDIENQPQPEIQIQ